ncbi:hypothetical protein PUMCH_003789 [Australozyma saopauloensis]|uniref:Uncharacterized protein n=1 Tax=Australozyma saopauloensis TaxID=291208 RepID=A0AAX4HD24_9ASCO|nr:hypothetical protein PUMCH_003789 [[Candida] saopauloensis]
MSTQDAAELLELDAVKTFMTSDGALEVLLVRLKQSLNTGDEIAKYVKKKAMIADENYGQLKKVAVNLRASMKASRQLKSDTFLKQFDLMVEFDEKLHKVGSSYVAALNVMYDEISSLIHTVTRQRKTIKEECKKKERDCADAIALADKAKQKYHHLCDDLEKVRTGDPNKKLFLSNKTAEQQEDDLQRKVDMADQDYRSKAASCRKMKDELLMVHRPMYSKKLKNLILEMDIAMNVQLQKYATWSETLIMNSGVMIAPLQSDKPSMKLIASNIDNERDLYDYIMKNSKLPTNRALVPIEYTAHPQFAKSAKPATPFFAKSQENSNNNQNNSSSTPTTISHAGASAGASTNLTGSTSLGQINPNTSVNSSGSGNAGNIGYGYSSLDPATTPELKGPKPIGNAGQPTFGESIEDVIQFAGVDNVPLVVKRCIDVIESYGLDIEGIYRTSGSKTAILQLKASIDSNFTNYLLIGGNVDPNNVLDADIYCTASLLKTYFSSLPEPLLTTEYYPEFIETVKSTDEQFIAKKLHHLVFKLPDGAYFTLRALIFHLNRVVAHLNNNRMTAKALSIIWGPVLMNDLSMSPQDLSYKSKVVDELMLIANEIFETD